MNTSTKNSLSTEDTKIDTTASPQSAGKLELLEERAVVHKQRVDVGKVVATKHTRTRSVNVPIELVEEVLTVTTTYQDTDSQSLLQGNYHDKEVIRQVEPVLGATASVTINGHQVVVGDEPIEIVLSRQVATINKETYVVQDIKIDKSTHTHTDSILVELQHEELDIQEDGFLSHEQ